MGKAAYCIQMLQLLSSGRVYKCSELADLLGTTPRSVIEYKKELAEVGYHITSITGKYGGYKLDTNTTIPCIKMTDEEKAALSEGSGYLLSRNDFINKKDYQLAMGKIYSSIDNTYSQVDPSIINRFPLVMTEEEIGRRYKALDECAKLKIKIEK